MFDWHARKTDVTLCNSKHCRETVICLSYGCVSDKFMCVHPPSNILCFVQLTALALSPHLGSLLPLCCCDPKSHSWEGANEHRHRGDEDDQWLSLKLLTHTHTPHIMTATVLIWPCSCTNTPEISKIFCQDHIQVHITALGMHEQLPCN